ncbi:unnamed protein product [Brachionus calyciflorus]|uniref:C2 domain-containing protein n=1 Tax=Brachionus calyciflorus TaxID=104777 RepID=A0A813UJ07_9BILA|nr:unnamed protein product [Brachionus calyciflorus]
MDDNDEPQNKRALQEGLTIGKLSRTDLEDKYLKIYDENIILKKHARKQEEKIKMMATKLIRLVNDKKKSSSKGTLNDSGGGKRMRDVDSEEYIAGIQNKLMELEQQNKKLKENLQISKIQLQSLQTQKNPVSNMYNNVTSRIDTGLPKRDPSFTKNIRTISSHRSGNLSSRSLATPNYNMNANNNNNNNNNLRRIQELEIENMDLKSKMDEYDAQIEAFNDHVHQLKAEHDEELTRLRGQVSQEHITTVQENIDQIRLQREIKDKVNQYSELYSKFSNLTQQQVQLKEKHDRLLDELERNNLQLKQEQQKNVSLKTELKNIQQNSREILELKERIEDLTRENQVLNEANQKLVNSAFSLDREREFRERERALKVQIAQLEATLKADVGEKGSILDKLNSERDHYDKLNSEMREIQIKYYDMKQKYDEMNEKMLFLNKESNIDFTEIEEALILVKERRANKNTDEFLGMVDSEKIKAYQRKIVDLECSLSETVSELDKSRHLLITQVKINENYKKEMLLIENKMEENKAEFDAKMTESAQMLDIRAARIKKLERQLKDVAYGTKQVRIPHDEVTPSGTKRRDSYSFVGAPEPHMLDNYLTSNLERGQNIFEIHLTKLILSPEAIRIMSESDPSTFCTIEFYEHEIQTTPIMKGQQAEYNFTSQYIIRVDDFFLHYLQKKTTTIELHQAIGSDYETRGACQLSFRDLIDREKSRIHGQVQLISVTPNNVGISLGTLEYWARLIVPVDQAFRLYKERVKALGYIASNSAALNEVNIKKQSNDNMNELNINILRCSKISGLSKAQPSAYCVYKFFDFEDQDTEIIKASNNPEFNSHKSFPVQMDMDLDKYLKNSALEIYVFDDNQAENDPSYLGMTQIELIRLSHDQEIKGTYELKRPDGSKNGTIDVTLYWQYTYLPPSASTFSASGSKAPKKMSENLLEKAIKMGIKSPSQGPSPSVSKPNSKHGSVSGSRTNVKLESPRLNDSRSPEEIRPSSKKNSISEEHSIGNATLYRKPDSRDSNTSTPNQHYNDTIFEDQRTQSPNDLEHLTNEYQNTVEMNKENYEDNDNYNREEDDEEIEENIISTYEKGIDEEDEETEDTYGVTMSGNFNKYVATTKSDNDVVTESWDPNNTNKMAKNGDENNVIIEIGSLKFNEGSQVLLRDDIQRLFVTMEFLDYDSSDLESKDEPKPLANKYVHFNFRKCFQIDSVEHLEKRQLLAEMILDKNKSNIRLVVVSQPMIDELDCEDVGYAFIDINDIMELNEDFINQELNLYDPNDLNCIIGKMTVTVEILKALNSIKQDIHEAMKE